MNLSTNQCTAKLTEIGIKQMLEFGVVTIQNVERMLLLFLYVVLYITQQEMQHFWGLLLSIFLPCRNNVFLYPGHQDACIFNKRYAIRTWVISVVTIITWNRN